MHALFCGTHKDMEPVTVMILNKRNRPKKCIDWCGPLLGESVLYNYCFSVANHNTGKSYALSSISESSTSMASLLDTAHTLLLISLSSCPIIKSTSELSI